MTTITTYIDSIWSPFPFCISWKKINLLLIFQTLPEQVTVVVITKLAFLLDSWICDIMAWIIGLLIKTWFSHLYYKISFLIWLIYFLIKRMSSCFILLSLKLTCLAIRSQVSKISRYLCIAQDLALCLIQVYFMQIQTPIQGIKVKLLTSQHVLIEFHLHKMESNLFWNLISYFKNYFLKYILVC